MATVLKLLWDGKWYVIGLVVIAAGLWFTYSAGQADIQSKWDKSAKDIKTRIEYVERVQVQETEKVVVKYLDRIERIVVKGDTLIKEVPIYVTKEDDARCTIGDGFVRMWNAANAGAQGIPDSAREVDGGTAQSGNVRPEGQSTP